VTAWTSSLAVIPASPSAQPESGSAQKTPGTSGLLSQTEFGFFAPDSAISKMSKDTSALDSEKSLESWNQSVTKRRGEYSARLKSAHRTSASACLSWPTISVNESKNSVGKSQEHRNSIPLGTMALMQDAANWPTPAVMDTTGGSYKTEWIDGRAVSYHNHKEENPVAYGAKLSDAVKYGQAAPANPSTDGSRPELWRTPSSSDGEGGVMEMREGCAGKYKLRDHVVAEQKSWATPRDQDHKHSLPTEYEMQSRMHNQLLHMQTGGKLNPRWVETLMGLPVGWVMPSCASPVTIEPTSYDSSATESCLPPQSEHSELFGRNSND
jgi:hypothetical protein